MAFGANGPAACVHPQDIDLEADIPVFHELAFTAI
jgi:hypothetical protein